MIRSGEAQDRDVTLEMTPLIDMVFLLLIFFLVATTFHQTEREMQIALPPAAFTGPISTALREIIINVDSDGSIIVSGRTIEPDDLRAMIAQAVEANPDQKVTLRGDTDFRFYTFGISKAQYNGRHFYGLWSSAEDGQYFKCHAIAPRVSIRIFSLKSAAFKLRNSL